MRTRVIVALSLLVAGALLASGCGGLPSEAAERPQASPSAATAEPVTAAQVAAVADLVSTLDNGRYEYFQFVVSADGATAGSEDVPIARGARSETGERLTAELGVDSAFAAENGTTTRLNVLAADDRVCMNAPFYERIVDQAGPSDEVAWMVPLIDGWGCLDADDVVDATGVPSASLELGTENRYLGMVEVLRSARVVSTEPGTYRGMPVNEAVVELDPVSVGSRFSVYADGAGAADGTAVVRFSARTGEVVAIRSTLTFSFGMVVTEHLEIYDRGAVELIELPDDATDITEPISRVLAD